MKVTVSTAISSFSFVRIFILISQLIVPLGIPNKRMLLTHSLASICYFFNFWRVYINSDEPMAHILQWAICYHWKLSKVYHHWWLPVLRKMESQFCFHLYFSDGKDTVHFFMLVGDFIFWKASTRFILLLGPFLWVIWCFEFSVNYIYILCQRSSL